MTSTTDSVREEQGRTAELHIKLRRFHLPPVASALVIGRRAGIGPKAMAKALDEMAPEAFEFIEVEHPVAEALLIRRSHLRTLSRERLTTLLLNHAEPIMDETDMIHVDLDVVLRATEEIRL